MNISTHRDTFNADIEVLPADIQGHEAQHLIEALSTRLAQITGDSGKTHFAVEDMSSPGACFLIARDRQGQAIGCAALRPLTPTIGEVKRMYAALPGRGIGTRLLDTLEQHARTLGYETLRLETRHVNRQAVDFYLRHGYVIIPNYGPYVGKEHAACFEKSLINS